MPTFTKKASLGGGLVMTLKEGSKISLNNGEMLIEFVQISGKYAKVCFKASREIRIHRVNEESAAGESIPGPASS